MCKEQRSQRVWMAIKLLGDGDGPSAAEQSQCRVPAVGAWWGLGDLQCLLEDLNSSISTNVCTPTLLLHLSSPAAWILCPAHWEMVSAEQVGVLTPCSGHLTTVAAALTLARLTHLVHRLESHFPSCAVLTVCSVGTGDGLNVPSGKVLWILSVKV